METSQGPNARCPVGNDECRLLDEVLRLRKECNRLEELAVTDSLTGLYNHRYLLSALDREMERTRRTSLPTGLIMIDLDHFKTVNDSYGHQAGDMTLQWASGLFRENVRRVDVPCRYGGEEFSIVLPATAVWQAVNLAERLRVLLQETPVEINDRSIRVTASFGVVAYKGEMEATALSFLDRADQMLLKAKTSGRNLVCSEPLEVMPVDTQVTTEERSELFGW